ncbi:hypothetical protein TVAG_154280 [Trichomonas vaginalis G3]|uniref:Uncharacterized protein n=1 Tax=Trichomonas vaginalis (strain ATCC PRA-98 / G3) TaxID=412133 RepID=A2E434_TRIV3|nr:hypothetical protein TVAGG3_0703530 [Trichomonas vaginalis G3]EAY12577.1 hypothetical protein TVAG_154280 [Trichomonas vaginalis G3]KAI5509406.1 hypothetical protein TVAGG3_0703530 [Trichomonas vaginalis G3]|eukprot:XP_001324800.1 hypothetical protein [Trichomonas vaginalis G3]
MTIDESFSSDDLVDSKTKTSKKTSKSPLESPNSVTSLTNPYTKSQEIDNISIPSVKSLRPKKRIRKSKASTGPISNSKTPSQYNDPFVSIDSFVEDDDKKSVKSTKSSRSKKQKLPPPPKYIKEDANLDRDIFEFDITKSSTVAVNDYQPALSVASHNSLQNEKGLLSSGLELDMTGDEQSKGTQSFVKSYLGNIKQKAKNNQKDTKKFNDDNPNLPPTTFDNDEILEEPKRLRPQKSRPSKTSQLKSRVSFYSGQETPEQNETQSLRTRKRSRKPTDNDFEASSELKSINRNKTKNTDDNYNSTLTSRANPSKSKTDTNNTQSTLPSKLEKSRETSKPDSKTSLRSLIDSKLGEDNFDAESELNTRGTRSKNISTPGTSPDSLKSQQKPSSSTKAEKDTTDLKSLAVQDRRKSSVIDDGSLETKASPQNQRDLNLDASSELRSRLNSLKAKQKYTDTNTINISSQQGPSIQSYQTSTSSINTNAKPNANLPESYDAGSEINTKYEKSSPKSNYSNSTLHSLPQNRSFKSNESTMNLTTQVRSEKSPETEEASSLFTKLDKKSTSKLNESNFDAGSELNSRLLNTSYSKDTKNDDSLFTLQKPPAGKTTHTKGETLESDSSEDSDLVTNDKLTSTSEMNIDNDLDDVDSLDSISFETNPDTDSIHQRTHESSTVFTEDSSKKSSLYTFNTFKKQNTDNSLAGSEKDSLQTKVTTEISISEPSETLTTIKLSPVKSSTYNNYDENTDINSKIYRKSKENDENNDEENSDSLFTKDAQKRDLNEESSKSLNSNKFKEKQKRMEQLMSELLESIDTQEPTQTKKNTYSIVQDTISVNSEMKSKKLSQESSSEGENSMNSKFDSYKIVSSDSYYEPTDSLETHFKNKNKKDSTVDTKEELNTNIDETRSTKSKSTLTFDVSINSKLNEKSQNKEMSSQKTINSLLTNEQSENTFEVTEEDDESLVSQRRKKKLKSETETFDISTNISSKSSLSDSESYDLTLNSLNNMKSDVSDSKSKSDSDSKSMLTNMSSEYESLDMVISESSMSSKKDKKKKKEEESSDFDLSTFISEDDESKSKSSTSEGMTINSQRFSKNDKTQTKDSQSKSLSMLTHSTDSYESSSVDMSNSSIVSLRKNKKKRVSHESSINISTQNDSSQSEKTNTSSTNDTINSNLFNNKQKSVRSTQTSEKATNSMSTNQPSEYDSQSVSFTNSSMISLSHKKKRKRDSDTSSLDVSTHTSNWNENISSGTITVDTINSELNKADKSKSKSTETNEETLKTGEYSSEYSDSISIDTDSLSSQKIKPKKKNLSSKSEITETEMKSDNSLWESVSVKDVMSSVPETLNSEGHHAAKSRDLSISNNNSSKESSMKTVSEQDSETSSRDTESFSISLDSNAPIMRRTKKKAVEAPESSIEIESTNSQWDPTQTFTLSNEKSDTLNSLNEKGDQSDPNEFTLVSHKSLQERALSTIDTDSITFDDDSEELNSQMRKRKVKKDDDTEISDSTISKDLISKRNYFEENADKSESDIVSLTINSKNEEQETSEITENAPSIYEKMNQIGIESSLVLSNSEFLNSDYRNLETETEPLDFSDSESINSEYKRRKEPRKQLDMASSIPETLTSEPLFQSSEWKVDSDYISEKEDKRFDDNYVYVDRTYRYNPSPMEIKFYQRVQAESMQSRRGLDFFFSDSETLEDADRKRSESSSSISMLTLNTMDNSEDLNSSTIKSIKSYKENKNQPKVDSETETDLDKSYDINSKLNQESESTTESNVKSLQTDFNKEPFRHNISESTASSFQTDHKMDEPVSYGSFLDDIYTKANLKDKSDTIASEKSIVTKTPTEQYELTSSSMMKDLNSNKLNPVNKNLQTREIEETTDDDQTVITAEPSSESTPKSSVTFQLNSVFEMNSSSVKEESTEITIRSKEDDLDFGIPSSEIELQSINVNKEDKFNTTEEISKQKVTTDKENTQDEDFTLLSPETETFNPKYMSDNGLSSIRTEKPKKEKVLVYKERDMNSSNFSLPKDSMVDSYSVSTNTEILSNEQILFPLSRRPASAIYEQSTDTIDIRSEQPKNRNKSENSTSIKLTTDTFISTSTDSKTMQYNSSLMSRVNSEQKARSKFLQNMSSSDSETDSLSTNNEEEEFDVESRQKSLISLSNKKFVSSESNIKSELTTQTSQSYIESDDDLCSLVSDENLPKDREISLSTSKTQTISVKTRNPTSESSISDINSLTTAKITQKETIVSDDINSLETITSTDQQQNEISDQSKTLKSEHLNARKDLSSSSKETSSKSIETNFGIEEIKARDVVLNEDELTLEEASERTIKSRDLVFSQKSDNIITSSQTTTSNSLTKNSLMTKKFSSDSETNDEDTKISIKSIISTRKHKYLNDDEDELSSLATEEDGIKQNDAMYSEALKSLHSKSLAAFEKLNSSSTSKSNMSEIETQTTFDSDKSTEETKSDINTIVSAKKYVPDSETGSDSIQTNNKQKIESESDSKLNKSLVSRKTMANFDSDSSSDTDSELASSTKSNNSVNEESKSIETVQERHIPVESNSSSISMKEKEEKMLSAESDNVLNKSLVSRKTMANFDSDSSSDTDSELESSTKSDISVNEDSKSIETVQERQIPVESNSSSISMKEKEDENLSTEKLTNNSLQSKISELKTQTNDETETTVDTNTMDIKDVSEYEDKSEIRTQISEKKFVSDSQVENEVSIKSKSDSIVSEISDIKSVQSNHQTKQDDSSETTKTNSELQSQTILTDKTVPETTNSELFSDKFNSKTDSISNNDSLKSDKFRDDSDDESTRVTIVSQHKSKYLISTSSSSSDIDDEIRSQSEENSASEQQKLTEINSQIEERCIKESQSNSSSFISKPISTTTSSNVSNKSLLSQKPRIVANFESSDSESEEEQIKSNSFVPNQISSETMDKEINSVVERKIDADSETGSNSINTKKDEEENESVSYQSKSLVSKHRSKYLSYSSSDEEEIQSQSDSKSYSEVVDNEEVNSKEIKQVPRELSIVSNKSIKSKLNFDSDENDLTENSSIKSEDVSQNDEEEDISTKSISSHISKYLDNDDENVDSNDKISSKKEEKIGKLESIPVSETLNTREESDSKSEDDEIVKSRSISSKYFVHSEKEDDNDYEEEIASKQQTDVSNDYSKSKEIDSKMEKHNISDTNPDSNSINMKQNEPIQTSETEESKSISSKESNQSRSEIGTISSLITSESGKSIQEDTDDEFLSVSSQSKHTSKYLVGDDDEEQDKFKDIEVSESSKSRTKNKYDVESDDDSSYESEEISLSDSEEEDKNDSNSEPIVANTIEPGDESSMAFESDLPNKKT